MIQVFEFYINQVIKVLAVMDSWVLVDFPRVTFLGLSITVSIICIFIKLIKFGLQDDFQRYVKFSTHNLGYVGKHTNEGYQPRHAKKRGVK